MCLDGVDSVAVGARRSLPVAVGQGGAVDAPLKFFSDGVVALAAGLRHVEFEDRGLRIFRIKNFVGAVAIGADRRLFRSIGDSMSVHTRLVGRYHLRALAAVCHDKLLAVTGAASCGDIRVTHARFRICCGKQFVWTAVAVYAGSGIAVATLNRLCVVTAIVDRLLIGMAGRARDFLWSRFMCGTLYIRVAVHAAEHAAMNRILESFRIDVQADGLAVYLVTQRSVTVAAKALIHCRFREIFFRSCREGNGG